MLFNIFFTIFIISLIVLNFLNETDEDMQREISSDCSRGNRFGVSEKEMKALKEEWKETIQFLLKLRMVTCFFCLVTGLVSVYELSLMTSDFFSS